MCNDTVLMSICFFLKYAIISPIAKKEKHVKNYVLNFMLKNKYSEAGQTVIVAATMRSWQWQPRMKKKVNLQWDGWEKTSCLECMITHSQHHSFDYNLKINSQDLVWGYNEYKCQNTRDMKSIAYFLPAHFINHLKF